MKVHFYQIYFKEREEQYEENLVEYFLSTIFMANVVAIAGTGDDYFNYVFEGGQSVMWTGSGTCDKIILFENITVTSQTNAIAWPFSITASVSASSASWNSEAFTGTNIAGASYSNFKISSSGTLRVSFVDGADIYKGNIVYRPMATIYYGI